ncbi:MAG TPA: TetR/AcrR family transcriptional regulator [Acidimicrobiales bacterium]
MSSAGEDEREFGARKRGRPPGQRSAETRDRILRAARARFSQSGYARTSLADIAREAGITPRAIYHYVESKPQLFRRAADAAYERFADAVSERVLGRADSRSRLHGLADVFRDLYREDPTIVAMLSQTVTEVYRNPELDRSMLMPEGYVPLNRVLVDMAVADGDLAEGVDPAGAAAMIEVLGSGLTLLASKEREHEYMAMLDVLERLLDGTLFVDRSEATGT